MSFFGGSGPIERKVPDAPILPKVSDVEVQAKKDAEEARIRKMKGRKSTILTSAQGVTEEAEVGKKTLLGN